MIYDLHLNYLQFVILLLQLSAHDLLIYLGLNLNLNLTRQHLSMDSNIIIVYLQLGIHLLLMHMHNLLITICMIELHIIRNLLVTIDYRMGPITTILYIMANPIVVHITLLHIQGQSHQLLQVLLGGLNIINFSNKVHVRFFLKLHRQHLLYVSLRQSSLDIISTQITHLLHRMSMKLVNNQKYARLMRRRQ